MKTLRTIMSIVCVIAAITVLAAAQDANKDQRIFENSLHRTSRGMAYWYDKARGGLETITGVPYSQLMCGSCHAASCEECHRTEKNGVSAYSTEAAKKQETCLKCHGRESAMILTIDNKANQTDVHIASVCVPAPYTSLSFLFSILPSRQ